MINLTKEQIKWLIDAIDLAVDHGCYPDDDEDIAETMRDSITKKLKESHV
jgi:hypothetical protein